REAAGPGDGEAVPMIFTAVEPGFVGASQREAAGWTSRPERRDSITAMSVPMFPGLVSSAVIHEFPGPPNWLKPKVPSRLFVGDSGRSTSAVERVPSSVQCPAVSTMGSPAGL